MSRDEALNKAIGILTYHQVNFCKSKEAVANMNEIIEALEKIDQEQCEDCISREKALQIIRAWFDREATPSDLKNEIEQLSSVTPQPEVGRWIYDKNINNWRCSECGETPKTMGYCGAADFMAEHFKYCNHCGCKMHEVEE